MLSNKQIALVHVACKQLGISEDDRHAMQKEITGTASLTRMDNADFEALARHLHDRGARIRINLPPHAGREQDPQLRLIFALWSDLEPTGYYEPRHKWRALRRFISKRFGIEHWRFLDNETKPKVIEAIKAIKKRRGG
jgi:hypothetical protein